MSHSPDLSASLEPLLTEAVDELGLSLGAHSKNLLLRYLDQLEKWNKTYNLTAIRDRRQMLVQHIFDSLAVVPVVNGLLNNSSGYLRTIPKQDKPVIVDVGSGAGLPGVVLSIACDADVHCVDAVEKKMTFIRQMVGVLGQENLFAHHQRIERMPSLQANIVISRAFSSLVDFTDLAGKHVMPGGIMLAMKGKEPKEEIRLLHEKGQWRVTQTCELTVPQLKAHRCVLLIEHQG